MLIFLYSKLYFMKIPPITGVQYWWYISPFVRIWSRFYVYSVAMAGVCIRKSPRNALFSGFSGVCIVLT